MAASATAAPLRRRKMIGRRRVEDDGEEEGAETFDVDDDSLTEGSLASDEHDRDDDSDTSNIDEASPVTPNLRKTNGDGNGNAHASSKARGGSRKQHADAAPSETSKKPASDMDVMMNGLSLADKAKEEEEANFDDAQSSTKAAAPVVVSSTAGQPLKRETAFDRQRREHDMYKQKRDEDPSFVPNRGAFFMHDHRGAGPSANGFRPFSRGGGRGRGRGGFGGPFGPMHQMHHPADPTTHGLWAHDMHDSLVEQTPPRPVARPIARHVMPAAEGPPNGNGIIPTCPSSSQPINRKMSTEKPLGTVVLRVVIPGHDGTILTTKLAAKQYTHLPDHRPPLRRDKPVRISIPDHPPRYIFPAVDRSFIFIPRAMRPNQRMQRKARNGWGSIGGYSRRTSVYGGGSYYAGSLYSPSVMSRRSSVAPADMGRDFVISPTGSTMSRPPMAAEAARPVVRLPPAAHPDQAMPPPFQVGDPTSLAMIGSQLPPLESSITDLPQPQMHPLPQKPAIQENRPVSLPMYQPRPYKAISVETIESPTKNMVSIPPLSMSPAGVHSQAFHQQVPPQVANAISASDHQRTTSYTSHTAGTPLPQIPEGAIHAAPFQPNHQNQYQQGFYPQQQQPQHSQQQMYPTMPGQHPGYYYPSYNGSAMVANPGAPPFVPGQATGFQPGSHADQQAAGGPNMVAQEVNGMVYYYDPNQMPTVPGYQSYSSPQSFMHQGTPNPDQYYYPQPAPGVYYPQ